MTDAAPANRPPPFTIFRWETNYWGQQVPVVDRDEWTVIRPIAEELNWPIRQAIRFGGGVKRVIFDGVNMTGEFNGSPSVFAIPKTQQAAFRKAGADYTAAKAARFAKSAEQRAAYERRQHLYREKLAIHRAYDDAITEARGEDQKGQKAASAALRKANDAASEIYEAACGASRQAYKAAEREAATDRDEALAELEADA